MKEKVAIITGATSGIGHASALLFAEQGIKIVAAGRNENAGKELVKEIASKGGEALFIQTDMANAQSIEKLIEGAVGHFGRLDFAVNNAGIEGVLAPLAEIEEKDWDSVMNTNLKGLWLCMKYEILAMGKTGGGSIVNISTNITRMSIPTTSIYTASKAAVETLGKIAAVEYGPQNIRINSISPGAVDTPMLRRIYTQEMIKEFTTTNPLRKLATPRDIANAALWLCSPQASHVNGTSFAIDGAG